MAEQGVEAVPFLDGLIDQMHHPPIQLHLFLQIALQRPDKVIHPLQPILHHLGIHLPLHIHLLFSLSPCLPVILFIVGFVRFKVNIHLVDRFVLLLQYLQTFFVGAVAFEIFEAVSIGVAVQPLQQYDIIVKFPLADLLERQRLGNL